MKTAFIVDSTAGLNEQLKAHLDVTMLNLTIRFANGEVIEDTTDTEQVRAFYRRLKAEATVPVTSQPSPGQYYELMDRLVAEGYEAVVAINLSSKLSGTYQTSRMVLSEYEDKLKVAAIDSKGTSVVIENMLEQGLAMVQKGFSFELMIEKLQWLAEHSHIYMVIEDLSNLVKSGRLSSTNAFLGSLLNIKPLLEFTDSGEVKLFEKIRTDKRVILRWEQLIQEALAKFPKGIHIRFAHGDAYEAVLAIQQKMQAQFPQVLSFGIGYLTPVVGVHGGNGVKGMAIIPDAMN